jgi:hypothetical protein
VPRLHPAATDSAATMAAEAKSFLTRFINV